MIDTYFGYVKSERTLRVEDWIHARKPGKDVTSKPRSPLCRVVSFQARKERKRVAARISHDIEKVCKVADTGNETEQQNEVDKRTCRR